VTVDKNRKCLAEVKCEKAQWGACEVRGLKWSERQQPVESDAPRALQAKGGAQVPPLRTHAPCKVLGKRTGRSQTPKRSNHTETSAEGPDGRGEAEQCPTAERESDLSSNGREDGRANEGEWGASDGGGASDVKDEEMEETDRAPLPRVTATGSENGTGVSNDSSPQRTEGGQPTSETRACSSEGSSSYLHEEKHREVRRS
jgi:hypothetical protein